MKLVRNVEYYEFVTQVAAWCARENLAFYNFVIEHFKTVHTVDETLQKEIFWAPFIKDGAASGACSRSQIKGLSQGIYIPESLKVCNLKCSGDWAKILTLSFTFKF